MSPLLFNIVVDMLAILTKRAKEEGQISGVVTHPVDGGLSVLNMLMTPYFLWNMISNRQKT